MSLEYTKKTFEVGDYLTANDINQISSALADSVSEVVTLKKSLDAFGKIDKIYCAILADNGSSVLEPLVTDYSVTAVKTAPSTVKITITGKNLKKHKNKSQQDGYWIGFAVVAPSGATKFKIGTTDLGDPEALENNVHEQEKGVGVYFNHGTSTATSVKIQWCSDSEPITEVVTYEVDMSGVTNATE